MCVKINVNYAQGIETLNKVILDYIIMLSSPKL